MGDVYQSRVAETPDDDPRGGDSPVDVHEWRLRCPGCETIVDVEWSDGNGAVWMDPKVRCANPMCGHDGPLTMVEADDAE